MLGAVKHSFMHSLTCVPSLQVTPYLKQCLKTYLGVSLFQEGNVLFNDALNTFYLWLYGFGHMVKDHSDSEREKPATLYD